MLVANRRLSIGTWDLEAVVVRFRRAYLATLTVCGLLATAAAAQAGTTQQYSGTIEVQRTYAAYVTNSGTQDASDEVQLTISNPVFALAPGSTAQSPSFTLQNPTSISYTRAPETQTTYQLGVTCIFTYSQDAGQQATGTLSLGTADPAQGVTQVLTVKVPIIVTTSANSSPSCGSDVNKGIEFFKIPVTVNLQLQSGFYGGITASGSQYFAASDPIGPINQVYQGGLYINSVEWVGLKRSVKSQAADRLEQQYRRAIEQCATQENYFAMAPFARILSKYYSADDCRQSAMEAWETASARLDPPDPNYQSVVLPASVTARTSQDGCAKMAKRDLRACHSLASAERRYESAQAELLSIDAAIVTTMNRASTAQSAGDTGAEQTQANALAVYDSWQQSVGHQADSAARALARVLERLHVLKRLSSQETASLFKRPLSGHVPAAMARALRSAGVSPSAFSSALRRAAPGLRPGRFTLASALKTPITPSPAPSAELQLNPANLAELATGLQTAGSLTSAQATTVLNAITAYEAAPSGSAAAARSSLVAAAATLPLTAQQFLDAAITLMA